MSAVRKKKKGLSFIEEKNFFGFFFEKRKEKNTRNIGEARKIARSRGAREPRPTVELGK